MRTAPLVTRDELTDLLFDEHRDQFVAIKARDKPRHAERDAVSHRVRGPVKQVNGHLGLSQTATDLLEVAGPWSDGEGHMRREGNRSQVTQDLLAGRREGRPREPQSEQTGVQVVVDLADDVSPAPAEGRLDTGGQ